MKTLEEYINEMHIEDDILKRIYFYTCIEFKLTHNLYPYIVESNGKFDNAGNVVKHIIDTLKEDFRSQVIDVRDDYVYFDYIDIKIDEKKNGTCGYIKYDNNTIYVQINASQKYFNDKIDDYVRLIMHELLHGYEDYNRIKNTGEGIYADFSIKYKNSVKNLNSLNEIRQYLSRCNYFLNDHERNAYLSQLEYDIEKIFKDAHITIENFNYTKFKDKLKSTDIWDEYFDLSVFIFTLQDSNLENRIKKYIEGIWSDLYNEDKRFSTIKKELYNNWMKFEKKFEQLVPRLVCQYIDMNLKEVCFDNSLLDEETYWDNLI